MGRRFAQARFSCVILHLQEHLLQISHASIEVGTFDHPWRRASNCLPCAGRRETDVKDTDLEAVITDLLEGQYRSPVRVVGFNTAQGWARDVSEDLADEIRRRCGMMAEVPASLQDFVERHDNRDSNQLRQRHLIRFPTTEMLIQLAGRGESAGKAAVIVNDR
jgi:peptidoglycan/xylan/chitin deacetylase (PgdA/CDA1 family)